MSDSDRLLSEKELSQLLGLSVFMVRKMRIKQGMPYIRAGTRVFYREQSVKRWLLKQEITDHDF